MVRTPEYLQENESGEVMCGEGEGHKGFYRELGSQRNDMILHLNGIVFAALLRIDCRSKSGSKEVVGAVITTQVRSEGDVGQSGSNDSGWLYFEVRAHRI